MSSQCISSVLGFKSAHTIYDDSRVLQFKTVIPQRDYSDAHPYIRLKSGRSSREKLFQIKADKRESSAGELKSLKEGQSSSASFLSILCPLLRLFAVSVKILIIPVIFYQQFFLFLR